MCQTQEQYDYNDTDFVTVDLILLRNKGRHQKRTIPIKAYETKIPIEYLKKINTSPVIPADQRGKHSNRPHAIKDNVKSYIRQHIESFPVIDSHYIRAESTRKYLENGLSISKMHRLYLE